MARLQIFGRVLFADSTPAIGARVRIYDLDGLADSTEHDLILDTTTGGGGRYVGRSSEWQDREGQIFGVDIPDVLRLEFQVNVYGKSHRGILFRNSSTGLCADVVLPFLPIEKADRELVQIIALSKDYQGDEKKLYQFIENASEGLTSLVLGGLYRTVTVVKGTDATLEGFVKALRVATGHAATKAVDVLVNTHGDTDELVFHDGTYPESDVLAALTTGLSADSRRKLRILFSTACFGKTHLDTWIAGGFNEASGSLGIYADSAVSFLPFLTTWAQGKTFAKAVDAANDADPLNLADGAARFYYLSVNKPARRRRSTATARGPATAALGFRPRRDAPGAASASGERRPSGRNRPLGYRLSCESKSRSRGFGRGRHEGPKRTGYRAPWATPRSR